MRKAEITVTVTWESALSALEQMVDKNIRNANYSERFGYGDVRRLNCLARLIDEAIKSREEQA